MWYGWNSWTVGQHDVTTQHATAGQVTVGQAVAHVVGQPQHVEVVQLVH